MISRNHRNLALIAAAIIFLYLWISLGLLHQSKGAQSPPSDISSNIDKDAGDTPTTVTPAERIETQAPPPPHFQAWNETFSIPKGLAFKPTGPSPEQFVLLTAADGGGHNSGIENILERALSNRQEYCDYQGYICHWANTSHPRYGDIRPKWRKLSAIIEAFETYPDAQWVWLLDLDAIIMTPTGDVIERLLNYERMKEQLMTKTKIKNMAWTTPDDVDPVDVDVLIAQDSGGINSGSILFRRSRGTAQLLDMWRDPILYEKAGERGDGEQNTLSHLIRTHPAVRAQVGIVPQRAIQSYLGNYKEGDLVIHLAGCWVDRACGQRWEKAWKMRERAPKTNPKRLGWMARMGLA